MRSPPPSPPGGADSICDQLLRPTWFRPRAHSDSGINLGATAVPVPKVPSRVVNAPPEKRQSIANSDVECTEWRVESCRRNVAELLARNVLDIASATTPPLAAQVAPHAPHAPVLVEDPPSTADEEDDDFLRVATVAGGPAPAPRFPNELLNGSSGNLSSTKSAPATPVGERLQPAAASTTSSGATRRRAAGTPTVAPATSTPTLVPLPSPATSKARHKKFHRHFDSVAPDERVLNYYSCALISDILLQGHLYITSNYFAFYSNVFGYVTKLLIPTASVLKVSKEKTARIIPNAIGVATSDEKHVFGSLLSRDNTYKLMVQVWKTALGPPDHDHPPQPLSLHPLLPLPCTKDLKDEVDSASGDILHEDDDSSLSGDGGPSGLPPVPLEKMPIVAATCKAPIVTPTGPVAVLAGPGAGLVAGLVAGVGVGVGAVPGAGAGPGLASGPAIEFGRSARQTVILGVSTALVAFLLLSTAFLFHRMSRIQDQFRMQSGENPYQDLARWQNHLHARSASQVEEFLNTHLDQLSKVRKSLEALTLLIVSNDKDDSMQQAEAADVIMHQHHHHSPYRDEKQQTRPPSPVHESNNS